MGISVKHYIDYQNYARELAWEEHIQIHYKDAEDEVSFTPYIYNNCSAACEFCSEQLVRCDGKRMICEELCADYPTRLHTVFELLREKQLFISLSGKEPTESVPLLEAIWAEVKYFEDHGGRITEKVMYSNLSGFCKYEAELFDLLKEGAISRVECSRHHYDEEVNQNIVHFKPNESIRRNDVFTAVVKTILKACTVKMVCVIQKKGISTIHEIIRYLKFAKETGVSQVVFRELAMFDTSIENGRVASYIVANRVEMMDILAELPNCGFRHLKITQGYYYFSFQYRYDGMNVYFEVSDYEEMQKKHQGSKNYKLIFYPNGKLCTDWNMSGETPLLEYMDIAKKLCSTADCVLIGSLSLYLKYPKVLDYVPRDADFYAADSLENLLKIITVLKENGYQVQSWQDIIGEDFDYSLLKNRYYIRGTKEDYVVDVTYEIEGVEFETMQCHELAYNGIKFYDKAGMITIMSLCDREDVVMRRKGLEGLY